MSTTSFPATIACLLRFIMNLKIYVIRLLFYQLRIPHLHVQPTLFPRVRLPAYPHSPTRLVCPLSRCRNTLGRIIPHVSNISATPPLPTCAFTSVRSHNYTLPSMSPPVQRHTLSPNHELVHSISSGGGYSRRF